VVISLNITGNSQMSIMMALEESRNHSISRLCRPGTSLEQELAAAAKGLPHSEQRIPKSRECPGSIIAKIDIPEPAHLSRQS